MARPRETPLVRHRRRMRRQGLVRVEVQVRKEDAALVRGVANALSDPAQAESARSMLRRRFAAPAGRSLKALLAAAPLDGIDIERDRDTGRDVEL